MKKAALILAVYTLFTFFGCEKTNEVKMTVVTDCTGTYLRQDGNDYKVCNYEKLDGFANGQTVSVTYSTISDCDDFLYACDMLHVFEGWIEVETVE
jgi:hypothetical protein